MSPYPILIFPPPQYGVFTPLPSDTPFTNQINALQSGIKRLSPGELFHPTPRASKHFPLDHYKFYTHLAFLLSPNHPAFPFMEWEVLFWSRNLKQLKRQWTTQFMHGFFHYIGFRTHNTVLMWIFIKNSAGALKNKIIYFGKEPLPGPL